MKNNHSWFQIAIGGTLCIISGMYLGSRLWKSDVSLKKDLTDGSSKSSDGVVAQAECFPVTSLSDAAGNTSGQSSLSSHSQPPNIPPISVPPLTSSNTAAAASANVHYNPVTLNTSNNFVFQLAGPESFMIQSLASDLAKTKSELQEMRKILKQLISHMIRHKIEIADISIIGALQLLKSSEENSCEQDFQLDPQYNRIKSAVYQATLLESKEFVSECGVTDDVVCQKLLGQMEENSIT